VNRQVPNPKYTIVGDGKVARHFAHYFDLVGIKYNCWNRKQSPIELKQSIHNSDVILLLITDDAIKEFINQHNLNKKNLVHFSGSLSLSDAYGCHPLMTFGHELYDLTGYTSIPFVCDNSVDFKSLFPQLKNQSFHINNESKAYYHALCVMAGNFTQTLMRETAKQLNQKLNLPQDILFPYLLQSTRNFVNDPEQSATGPIQRGDFATINNHLQVMYGDPLDGIYRSFLKFSNVDIPSFTRETPSLLRRQEPHQACYDLKKNTEYLGDSCLNRNDEVTFGNNHNYITEAAQ